MNEIVNKVWEFYAKKYFPFLLIPNSVTQNCQNFFFFKLSLVSKIPLPYIFLPYGRLSYHVLCIFTKVYKIFPKGV